MTIATLLTPSIQVSTCTSSCTSSVSGSVVDSQVTSSKCALIKALAKAKLEFKPIKKDAVNHGFNSRYATLDRILDATTEALSKNGLVVTHQISTTATSAIVRTILMHEAGAEISCQIAIQISKPNAHGLASAVTYGRRYGYSALLAIAADEDDDGNEAVGLDTNNNNNNQYNGRRN